MPILSFIEPRGPTLVARRHTLACHFAGERLMRALTRLQALVEKGGFNPDQPRVPAGSPEGGQWGGGEGGGQSRRPAIGDNGGPALDPADSSKPLQKDKPGKVRAGKALAKAIARRAGPIGAVLAAIEAGQKLYDEWPSIRSYQNEPQSLAELQQHAGKKRPGYDDHHIVEQAAGSRQGFPRTDIDDMANVVSIPRYKHHEITGWYTKQNTNYGNLAPRDYLRGKSWAEHVDVGHQALRLFKVMK